MNQGAFSDSVADAYWGYILPETFEDARILILHIRTNPNLGGPSTFCDLEELCQKWIERDPERHGGQPLNKLASGTIDRIQLFE